MATKSTEHKTEDSFDVNTLENLPFEFDRYDGKEILYFVSWFLKRGTSCEDCILSKKLTTKRPPNCIKCGLPTARLLKKHFNKERPYEKV